MKICILCNKVLKPFEDNFCEHCVRNKSMKDRFKALAERERIRRLDIQKKKK